MNRTERLARRCARLIAAALLCSAWAPAATAADLTDLSLEELLSIELDQMSLTGIHHVHEKGEWMLGYTFMQMDMNGNLQGTTELTPQQVLAEGYMVAPTDMTMQMHMIHVMYGITDRLTAMLMVPYLHKTMDHLRMDGVRFRTESSGIGDVGLGALYQVFKNQMHTVTAQAGLEFPTGSIDVVGADPALNPAVVPTADPSLRAGRRLDFIAGANVFQTEGPFEGMRLALEGGVPMYQSLTGPQLGTSWMLSTRFEKSF